jgi:twitching motility two-component system response regulator PilG
MRSELVSPRPESGGEEELAAALAAARGGEREKAQELAWRSLRGNPRRESTWLLLAALVPSREDQEMCLRQVLAINPWHTVAQGWFTRVTESEHTSALPLPFPGPAPPPAPAPALVPPPAPAQSEKPVARGFAFDRHFDTVPLTAAEPPPVHLAPAAPAAPRPRVLVVDDSATVRRMVTLALERLGCEVITAAAGLEALGAMSHATPDLVLLDIGLPNLDGHQICRAIRRNERTRDVPVVMLTGRDGLMDRLRGKMAGASEYLSKPFDPQALTAVLRKYLPLAEEEER